MSEKQLSVAMMQALGINARTLSWPRLREALGIHQAPEQLARIMRAYNDRLPAPRLPRWKENELFSRYSLPILELTPEDQQRAQDLKDLLNQESPPADFLEQLHALIQAYPHVPVLYNLESTYYRITEQPEKWKLFNESLLERFPGYLYPACALASFYLKAHQPEKVLPLFHHQIELADFDAEEGRLFETGEVSSFYGVMAWYHLFEVRVLRGCLCMSLVHAARPQDPFLDTLTSWLLELPDENMLMLRDILHGW